MRMAYFPGCKAHFHLKPYGAAVEAVMKHLGVTLVRLPFNCCGNPARGKSLVASVLAAVKNISLAESRGLDIFTPCKCCYGQLKHGLHWYSTDPGIREQVNLLLAEERMVFRGRGLVQDPVSGRLDKRAVRIRHLLDFLYRDLGRDRFAGMVRQGGPRKKIVLQQGCHALRPFTVTQFDDPSAPRIFRELARIIGLEVLDWTRETECCGDPVAETHKDMALSMGREKLIHARNAGADYICTACTHCQIQYERIGQETGRARALPFVVFLAESIGADPGKLPKAWNR